ncbi:MAG: ComF family protein, partial [bacterium]
PVPLTKKKYKDRGFNQSELISKYCFDFSKKIKVDLLHKIKNTKDQKQLESEERSRNLVNAFELSNKEIIQGKRILIVDDVITTGSTIKTVAELLVKSGCKEVNVFSLFKV